MEMRCLIDYVKCGNKYPSMPRLHEYAEKGLGYYIKHGFRQGGRMVFVTYQLSSTAVELIEKSSLKPGDDVPEPLFERLRDQGHIYTGGSGTGEAELEEVLESLGASRGVSHDDLNFKEKLKRGTDDSNLSEKELTGRVFASTKFTQDEITEHHAEISKAREKKRKLKLKKTGAVQSGKQGQEPIAGSSLLADPSYYSSRHMVWSWEVVERQAAPEQFCESIHKQYECDFLSRVWRYFEYRGMASYRCQSEFNTVLGRLMALALVMRQVGYSVYEFPFDIEEVDCWGQGLPCAVSELKDRFQRQETKSAYLSLVESLLPEVMERLRDYYEDCLGEEYPGELCFALIDDLREVYSCSESMADDWFDGEFCKDVGYTPREMDHMQYINERFHMC